MIQYYDKITRGSEHEDMLVIFQFFKTMVGKRFTFLNYYKEIPVSYDATLINVENNMAEFDVHEYQAKAITLEDRKVLIHSHEKSPFREDVIGEAFYVNIAKKKVVICNFGYAKINSEMRKFVRVMLDKPVAIQLTLESTVVSGFIKDISLGGSAISIMSNDFLSPGMTLDAVLKLPDSNSGSINQVGLTATVVRIIGEEAPFICLLEFRPEKHSQQQISYYINLRQVEIIKELKELVI